MKIKQIKIPLILIFFYVGNIFLSAQNDASSALGIFEERKPERIISTRSTFSEQENFFDGDDSFSTSKDNDDMLKAAPPELGGDGNYNPGGQVNPDNTLPFHDGFLFLGILVFLYANIRWISIKRKNK